MPYIRNFLLAILLFFGSHFSLASDKEFVWSVVPQFTGIAVHKTWTPLLDKLEEGTGYKFKLKIYEDVPSFEVGFLNGEPDFAYMNPYHAVMAKKAHGYMPIIRNGERLLTGILVVRSDSTINDVQALNGSDIAFPPPNAFAASLYMRALLKEKEKIEFNPIWAGTHSNSYRQVLLGKADASGGVFRTLKKERDEVQNGLKVIYQTPSSPSHPLTVHHRVPEDLKKAVQNIILDFWNTEHGKGVLKSILLSNPIAADYDQDYKPLEELGLEKYIIKKNNQE